MVNTIFILDKNLKTYKVLTVNGKNSFFNDIYIQEIMIQVQRALNFLLILKIYQKVNM